MSNSTFEHCLICLETYNNTDIIEITKCDHKFHKSCLDHWLSIKTNCPCCKYNLMRINI